VAFKPSQKRKREEEEVEINLLPMMNIVCSLIVLLLGVAQMTSISMLEYLPPAEAVETTDESAPAVEASKWNNDATIDLLVNVASGSLQVSLFGHLDPGPYFYEIPRLPGGDYDFKTLTDSLAEFKAREVGNPIGIDSLLNDASGRMDVFPVYRYRDGREVTITAMGETQFQTIVFTMDACRNRVVNGETKELFPVALLKQFQ